MAKSSTTAWQTEVRKIMKDQDVTWAQAKKIRARALKNGGQTTPKKARRARADDGAIELQGEPIHGELQACECSLIVGLISVAECLVDACGGDVSRAIEVLTTYGKLHASVQPPAQNLSVTETRTVQAKNGSAAPAANPPASK